VPGDVIAHGARALKPIENYVSFQLRRRLSLRRSQNVALCRFLF
jgi:hypothetical protein